MSRRHLYISRGPSFIRAIEFEVATAITKNATDYRTLEVHRIRSGQATGEEVGSTFSFATRSLAANTRASLFDDLEGLNLDDGESLALFTEEAGSPAVFDGLTVHLDVERLVQ